METHFTILNQCKEYRYISYVIMTNMKRLFFWISTLTAISTPFAVISCSNSQPSNKNVLQNQQPQPIVQPIPHISFMPPQPTPGSLIPGTPEYENARRIYIARSGFANAGIMFDAMHNHY